MDSFPTPSPDQHRAFPPHIETLLSQAPSRNNLEEVATELFYGDVTNETVSLWKNATQEDATRLLDWVEGNVFHRWGVLLMFLASLLAGGATAYRVWLLPDYQASDLLVHVSISGVGFALAFILVMDLLIMPLSGVWNLMFGCTYANRIEDCASVVCDAEIQRARQALVGRTRALTYLDEVQARRPLVGQDIRIARKF
jgi:hypothetical protein